MSYLDEKTFEELIFNFVWEYGRINERDRKQTQVCIEKEMKRRLNSLLNILKNDEQMKRELETKDASEIARSLMKWSINNGKES